MPGRLSCDRMALSINWKQDPVIQDVPTTPVGCAVPMQILHSKNSLVRGRSDYQGGCPMVWGNPFWTSYLSGAIPIPH